MSDKQHLLRKMTSMKTVKQNVSRVLSELPEGVRLVAAVKSRQPDEILEAIEAGVRIIGENYVQDAEKLYEIIGKRVEWHLIGHLQKNKSKKAAAIFDMIETVDSVEIARMIDKNCARLGKIMPVLIEVNSGHERQKTGVFPENVERLVREVSTLPNIKVVGLMTIGPHLSNPGKLRPYFAETRGLFEKIKQLNLPDVEMRYLSMGMSDSYWVAIEEGASIVRLGTKLFGERKSKRILSARMPNAALDLQ